MRPAQIDAISSEIGGSQAFGKRATNIKEPQAVRAAQVLACADCKGINLQRMHIHRERADRLRTIDEQRHAPHAADTAQFGQVRTRSGRKRDRRHDDQPGIRVDGIGDRLHRDRKVRPGFDHPDFDTVAIPHVVEGVDTVGVLHLL